MHAIRSLALLAACTALAGCAGSSTAPTEPSAPAGASEPPLATATVANPNGLAEGVIGAAELTVDPATLEASLSPMRLAAAQGDLAILSTRPFLGPDDLKVTRVERGTGGAIDVTVRFRHPFAAPTDINPPATPLKRIDLHAFDVTALVIADGTDTFFDNDSPVTANTDLVGNADAYRDPGPIFDPAALGAPNASIFPYKLVAQNIDTGNPQGSYDPINGGWTGTGLLNPTGYDIFPQGAEVEVTFALNLGVTPASFPLVTLAKYLQPKTQMAGKPNKLPIAGDITALLYYLPEAAGDVQRIGATMTGTLTSLSTSESATLDLEILDWDHGAALATTFPNPANPDEISEPSDVGTIQVDFPQLYAPSNFTAGAIGGTAPLLTTQAAITNVDALDTGSSDLEVTGLIRVTDAQDLDDLTDPTPPTVLTETNPPLPIPGAILSSTRYQVARVTVEVPVGAAVVMDPYPVPGGINWNMTTMQVLANASCKTPLVAESTGGDVYQMMIQNISGPYMVYRSTNGGVSWPGPTGNPLPNWAGGAITPTNSNFTLGILANGLPAVGVRDSGSDLGYIAAQSESAGAIIWGSAANGVEIETAGTWTQPNVVPHPTDPNRVYLIAQNTNSGGGPNYRQISLYLSTNGASANPTFALLPTVADSINLGVSTEGDIKAVMDSTGAFHIAWILDAPDEVYYRKFIDDGTAGGGAWTGPEIVIGTKVGPSGTFFSADIAVNALGEPAVAWVDEDPLSPPFATGNANMVMLTKYNTGTGWSPQTRVSLESGTYENNIFYPDIAFDGDNRITVVWRDTRELYTTISNVIYEVWGSISSPDGQTKLFEDFEILNGATLADDFPQMPRAVYSSFSDRVIVTSDVFDNATVINDGRYRYRTFLVTP